MKNIMPKQIISLERLRQGTGGTTQNVKPAPPPDLARTLHSLELCDPRHRNPKDGEFILGLYKQSDGLAVPILLWADPNVDLFWDVARGEHVNAPLFYLRMPEQPVIDPSKGRPVLGSIDCQFRILP